MRCLCSAGPLQYSPDTGSFCPHPLHPTPPYPTPPPALPPPSPTTLPTPQPPSPPPPGLPYQGGKLDIQLLQSELARRLLHDPRYSPLAGLVHKLASGGGKGAPTASA